MKANSLIISSVILGGLFCCEQSATVEETSGSGRSGAITLSRDQAGNLGLELGQLDSVWIRKKFQTNGYVDVPPQGRASVTTYKAGYVKEVSLLVGDEVKKGQQLAVLEHPDYVKMQQEYLELSGRLSYLKSEYDRQRSLFEDKITAEKNLLKAKSEYNSAEAHFKGLLEELKMLGLSPKRIGEGKISSTIRINSPINGFVTAVGCTVGKYIPASTEMFEIVDPDHLHMELNVFEEDVVKVKIGQRVVAGIPNVGENSLEGTVFLVGQTLDDETRSIRVHAHFENETTGVMPGMYLEARIITEEAKVLALPAASLVAEGEDRFVFVQQTETDELSVYQKVKVDTGREDEDWVEITSGGELKGRQVVVQGAFSLGGFGGQ